MSSKNQNQCPDVTGTGVQLTPENAGCTLAANLEKGIGLFPDAPTERGVKHLNELASAAKQGYHCSIAFVIQMNGIHRVLPNNATQPEFGAALSRAAETGVQILYCSCRVEADRIEITEELRGSREKIPGDTHGESI